MSALRSYLLSVACVSLLTGTILALLPKGHAQSVARLVGAMILVITVVAPVLDLDVSTMPMELEQIRIDASDLQRDALSERDALFAQIIKEQCETYILDRAKRSGLELDVQITVGYSDHPYPDGVKLCGRFSPADKRYMSTMIEQDLGIPIQKQEWVELE